MVDEFDDITSKEDVEDDGDKDASKSGCMAWTFPVEDVGNNDDSDFFNDWSSSYKNLLLMVCENDFGSI